MAPIKRVSKRLKRMRVERGLSQQALATKAKISRGYLARLEAAEQDPTLGVLERLAKALGLPVTALVEGGREAMSADPEPFRLTDVVQAVGGWPSDPAAVARVLDGADALLPEGRETYRPLCTGGGGALVPAARGLTS